MFRGVLLTGGFGLVMSHVGYSFKKLFWVV